MHPESLVRFQPRLFLTSLKPGFSAQDRKEEVSVYAYSHAEAAQVAARLYFARRQCPKVETVSVGTRIERHGWHSLTVDSTGKVSTGYGTPLTFTVAPPKPKTPDLTAEGACLLALLERGAA